MYKIVSLVLSVSPPVCHQPKPYNITMRKGIVTFYCFFLCLLYGPGVLYAQNAALDSLTDKIGFYGKKNTSSILFAHFDKNIYVNNENVWFTAYLLNYNKQINNPSILSILLVNDNNKRQVLEQKFVMADGLAFGNVFIPDSIPPGDYSFILYTNVLTNGKPNDIFTQPIAIKTTSKPSINASLNLVDTAKATSGIRKVVLTVITKDGKPIAGAEVAYHLGSYQHPVTSGKIKTDNEGRYIFLIPVNQVIAGENTLEADIKYNKETRNIRLVLPMAEDKFIVKFYPEGGDLVHGTQSIVGWEAKNVYGAPLKVTGVLYKDKRAADTIHTDDYGIGRFKLIPLMGSDYEVRLIGTRKDTIYQLPKILAKGPVISIKDAIANDTLKIRLVSKYPKKLFLMVHNYRQIYFTASVEVGAAGKMALVILKDVPKGLNTITILDSLQRPYAERIFFAHYDRRTPINISTDSSIYKTRQKVKLKLKLDAKDTLKGMVSVACVQSNRVEIKKMNDIESYVYLKHELENMPIREKYMGQGSDDKDYLENVLLVKGWRRYKWQELIEVSSVDTINKSSNVPPFEGQVIRYGKQLKKATELMLMTDSAAKIIPTDKAGYFKLNRDAVATPEGRKIHLLLNNRNFAYEIKMMNTFPKIDDQLLEKFKPQNINFLSQTEASTNTQMLNGFEHAINLKEVKIISKKHSEIYDSSNLNSGATENECGDYVCRYGFLNCPIHPREPDNRAPKIGETYKVGLTGHLVVAYKGCIVSPKYSALTLDGIAFGKEFYGSDYSQLNPSQPEYLSTIYWKHACFVNSKKETELSFYTSDITGPFKIIVQGITANDVIYGEKEFDVKKP